MYTTAALGFFSALTGLALGLVFFRWNAVLREPRKVLPYANGWMWWHHGLGLLFGVVTLTWALSGFFSWHPGGFFPPALDPGGADRFRDGVLSASTFTGIQALSQVVPHAREIDLADGITRYEHLYNHQHHDHMICSECGKIIEFYSAELEALRAVGVLDHPVERDVLRPAHHDRSHVGSPRVVGCHRCRRRGVGELGAALPPISFSARRL